MKLKRQSILALFVAAVYVPTAMAGESVVIAAQEATATLVPRAPKMQLVNLPALDFGLRAAIKCSGTAESLTLSVADSHVTLDKDALADRRSAEVTLTVPARQIALAASGNFCVADDDDAERSDELLVPGMATAHASLRCNNEGRISVHFASAPLQVRLHCSRTGAEDQEPPPDR
ncbi:MAG: hypothetical protein OEY37_01020 [Gammaproteobacteria bacterium]|nr:hypothetical protein [Gammaproteobacteria bacterium]MDH5619343.1 hypothetical protein [Gammaproteobacteria bacterium]